MGGICQGKARGNAPAIVDVDSTVHDSGLQERGHVLLYVDDETTPLSIQHDVGSGLQSVLQSLAKVYLPIKHGNSQICVWEEGSWFIKGHFHNAVKLAENLP